MFDLVDQIARFHTKYIIDEETGCWLWKAKLKNAADRPNQKVYGHYVIDGKQLRAHSAAMFLLKGIDIERKQFSHTCGRGHCVNPEHVFERTHFGGSTVESRVANRNKAKRANLATTPAPTELEVFHSRYIIDEGSGCWMWQMTREVKPDKKTRNFYGAVKFNGKWVLAHQAALLHEGVCLEGKKVYHTCVNAACVNPQHLLALGPEDHELNRQLHRTNRVAFIKKHRAAVVYETNDSVEIAIQDAHAAMQRDIMEGNYPNTVTNSVPLNKADFQVPLPGKKLNTIR